MVAIFTHIHHIVTVNADANRPLQFSTAFAKLPQELCCCCEYLDLVVGTVSHIHIPSAVKCQIPGMVELSIVTATAAKATEECQVRVQNLNTVIAVVCNIHFLVVWVNSNTHWANKLKRILTFLAHYSNKDAIGRELLNAMFLPIHHQYIALTIHCHTTRGTKLSMS